MLVMYYLPWDLARLGCRSGCGGVGSVYSFSISSPRPDSVAAPACRRGCCRLRWVDGMDRGRDVWLPAGVGMVMGGDEGEG